MRIDKELEPHLTKSIERMAHEQAEDRVLNGFNPFPNLTTDQIQRMTDGEIAYALLGVRP